MIFLVLYGVTINISSNSNSKSYSHMCKKAFNNVCCDAEMINRVSCLHCWNFKEILNTNYWDWWLIFHLNGLIDMLKKWGITIEI